MTTKKKKIDQGLGLGLEDPNPGGGGGGGSTSSTSLPPPPHGGPPDRMSELPVEILHRILGFLEMDEFLIGTSLVSTKWKNLWKSVSALKFPICTTSWRIVDNGGGGIRNNVEKYHNFIDHVLRLRDSQASKIQFFGYYCDDDYNSSREGGGGRGRGRGGYDYFERLHNFIVSAVVNQGAQEIQINGFHLLEEEEEEKVMIIHFNPSIFTSGGELRKFTFQVLNVHYPIQFPPSMCCAATQLTYLRLYHIRLPEGDDDESNAAQLHLVCPLLETFYMSGCYTEHLKLLDISAPRLKTLCISNYGMRRGHFDFLGVCRIEIRTPNLTSLEIHGDTYVDCFTENLPRIADATLQISKEPPGMMEEKTSFATKLLKGLTSAHSIFLEGFEVFSQDTLKCLLTPFTSLTTLKLGSCYEISSIHGAVHFLSSCNSIRKFVWELDEFVDVEGDEHLMLPQCKLSHLKLVHIRGLRGHENEIEFVKFLLKSSVVLEDLIIIHTFRDSPKQTIEENLKQFIEEEPSCRSIKLHFELPR